MDNTEKETCNKIIKFVKSDTCKNITYVVLGSGLLSTIILLIVDNVNTFSLSSSMF